MADTTLQRPELATQPPPELPLATVAFHPRTQWANGLLVWVTFRPDGRPVRASCRWPVCPDA